MAYLLIDPNLKEDDSYEIVLRRNSDGLTLTIPQEYPFKEESEVFWWTEGNFSCDCNRELEFDRALGENPELDDDDAKCGDTRYTLLEIRKSGPRRIQS